MYRAYLNRGPRPITHRVTFFSRFSLLFIYMYLSLMKEFCNTFLWNYESQKSEIWYINMDNGWLNHAYQNRGQGPLTHRVMFLIRFWHLFIFMYLSLMKKFCNTILWNYESQKLKLGKNMDNGWVYRAYLNRGPRAHNSQLCFLVGLHL